MSQPPRKAPSQPGLKQNNQGHAKKARPHRSNSQSKPPSVKATDGYAMGSYDNDVVNEPASTPSWMRDTPSEPTMSKVPSSPSFPASPSPSIPTSNTHLVAPIPFHLPNFATNASTAPMQSFAPNFNAPPHAPFGLLPPTGLATLPTPTTTNGVTGLVPLSNGFTGAYMAPPASAPPSTHPLPTQDAIARILALQQANAHMSTSTTPLTYPTPQEGYNQNSVNFSRNFTEDARTCQPPNPALLGSMPSSAPPSNTAATPLNNPFASTPSNLHPGAMGSSQVSAAQPHHQNQGSAMSPFQFPMQSATMTVPTPATSTPATGSAAVSLDHLMSMQQQTNQMRQSLDQSRLSSGGGGGHAIRAVQSNGHHPHHPTDILFEPSPAARLPNKTSAKHLANRSGAPIHAHHNYGLPAQP